MVEPGSRLGPYEIVARIGAGGMGEVYRAHDTRLGRDVALKILAPGVSGDEAGRKRFLREARAISALTHPNICTLYDIGQENGHDFLVMELLEGETLAQRLASRGPLPVEEAVRYAIDIASALERAHRKGIVHRDLKPGNVMITATGAKLLDFGLARLAIQSEEPVSAPLTTEGLMIGTVEYMSPEQLNGEPVDVRSDIFAFGALLYEMLSGSRPFTGKNRASVIGAILFGQPEPLSIQDGEIPPALERLVSACLEKDPDNRLQTAHDLRLQLQWSGEGERAEVTPRRRRGRIARGALVVASAIAFAIGCLAAGAIVWRLRTVHPRQVRFTLPAPAPGQQIDWPVISPDGTKVAYVVETSDGQRSLWLRELAATTARPLAGTEGAKQPFWSPDSSAVAFFSADKLHIARLNATRSQPLVSTIGPRGGTWGPSGILYTPHINTAIWMTTVAGTEGRELTRLDQANRDVTHRWPEFLPDGEHFIFVIRSRNLQRSGLYAGSLKSRALKKISTLQSRAVVSSNGWMFFQQDQKLWRQRFDLRRLELTGQPVVVATDVVPDLKTTGAVRTSLSHTGILTFVSPADMRTSLVWVDRSGRPLQTLAPPGHYVNPNLAPDGKTLALSRIDEETGLNSIWLMDAATGSSTPFVSEDANADGPVWTADGKRILYTSDRRGAYEVFERRVGSVAEDRLVLPSKTYAQPLSAARTGTLFHMSATQGSGGYWFLPTGAARPLPLDREIGTGAGACDLSRDGQWLARLKIGTKSARYGLEVTSFANPGRRIDIGGEGGSQPEWRSDGRELYYLSAESRVTAVDFRDGEVGRATVLFPLPMRSTFYANHDFVPSIDGQRFLIFQPVAREQSSTATVVLNWEAE